MGGIKLIVGKSFTGSTLIIIFAVSLNSESETIIFNVSFPYQLVIGLIFIISFLIVSSKCFGLMILHFKDFILLSGSKA